MPINRHNIAAKLEKFIDKLDKFCFPTPPLIHYSASQTRGDLPFPFVGFDGQTYYIPALSDIYLILPGKLPNTCEAKLSGNRTYYINEPVGTVLARWCALGTLYFMQIPFYLKFWKWISAIRKLVKIRAYTSKYYNDTKMCVITKIIDE